MSELLQFLKNQEFVQAANHINTGGAIFPNEIDVSCNGWNYSLIHYAVYHNQPELLRLLIGRGCNRGLLNNTGLTPLQMALNFGFWDCIRVFAENDSDPADSARYRQVALQLIESRETARYDWAIILLARIPNITGQDAVDLARKAIATANANLITHVVKSTRIAITDYHTQGFRTLCLQNDPDGVRDLLRRGAKPPSDLILEYANTNRWDWVNLFFDNLHANLIPHFQVCINDCNMINIQQNVIGQHALDRILFLTRRKSVPSLAGPLRREKYQRALTLLQTINGRITGQNATDIVLFALKSSNATLIDHVLGAANIDFQAANHDASFTAAYENSERNQIELLLRRRAQPPHTLIQSIADDNKWDWVELFINNLAEAIRPRYQTLLNTLLNTAINQADPGLPNVPGELLPYRGYQVCYLMLKGATPTQAMQVEFVNERFRSLAETALAQRAGNTDYKPAAVLAFRQQWALLGQLTEHPTVANDAAEYGVAMVIAAYHGEFKLARRLLTRGAQINARCGVHATNVVYGAIKHWQKEPGFLRELLQRDDALINTVMTGFPEPLYPIQQAIQSSNRLLIHFLLEHAATPFPIANNDLIKAARLTQWDLVQDFLQRSIARPIHLSVHHLLGELLHIAAEQSGANPDTAKILHWLLQMHAPKNYKKEGLTAIQRITDLGAWDAIKVFSCYPTDDNDTAHYGYALLRCIQVNRIQDALALIEMGASGSCIAMRGKHVFINDLGENQTLELSWEEFNYSPLHYAVLKSEDHPRLLPALLTRRPDINLAAKGITPLRLAIVESKATAIEQLMQNNAAVDRADLEKLLIVAQGRREKDWPMISAFIRNDALVPAEKYMTYHEMLQIAIEQKNRDLILLLRDRLTGQLANVKDSLRIVFAAKNQQWDVVKLLVTPLTVATAQIRRDCLLAAFLSIVHREGLAAGYWRWVPGVLRLDHHLLALSEDPLGQLSVDELSLTGIDSKQKDYNAFMFSIDAFPPNNQFASEFFRSNDYKNTLAALGKRYLEIGFAAKNKMVVAKLGQDGITPDLKTVIEASRNDWECVVEYLKNSIQKTDCTTILKALQECCNDPEQQRFLQKMMVLRETLPQYQQIQQACSASIILLLGCYLLDFLNLAQLSLSVTVLSAIVCVVLSAQHPDNKAVIVLQNGLTQAQIQSSVLFNWGKEKGHAQFSRLTLWARSRIVSGPEEIVGNDEQVIGNVSH